MQTLLLDTNEFQRLAGAKGLVLYMKRSFSIVLVVAMIQLVCLSTSFADPIHDDARDGNLAEVTRLITEDPANIEARDQNGFTPLHDAASGGHTAIVQVLIAAGANVKVHDQVGWTPLHIAASTSHTATAQALIAHGADVEARNQNGRTPLQIAQLFLRDTIVAALQPNAIAQLHTQTADAHTAAGNQALAARSHTWAAQALPETEEARLSYTRAAESFIAAGNLGAAGKSYDLAGNHVLAAERHTQHAHAQAAAGDFASAVEHYRLSHAAHTALGNHEGAVLSQVMANRYSPIVDGQRHAQTMKSHFETAVVRLGEMRSHPDRGDEVASDLAKEQVRESLESADRSEAEAISAFEAALVALDDALADAMTAHKQAQVANARALVGVKRSREEFAPVANPPAEHLAQHAATEESLRAHIATVYSKIAETRASAAAGHASVSAASGI